MSPLPLTSCEAFARISLPEAMSSIPRIIIKGHSAHTHRLLLSNLLEDDLSIV